MGERQSQLVYGRAEKRGTFDPASKQLLPYFRRGDIMRLIQLDGIPQWASPTGKETHSYAPTSLAQMKDYMAKVGAESNRTRMTYFPKQRDNYYQVTWEPDADGGLPWRDTDANFVAMYKAVWEGIHQTDPHAVVMGVTYASVQVNVEWMRRLGPLGIGRYMDGMTIHGYYDIGTTPSHPPERVADSGNQGTVPGALPAAMRALRHELRLYLKPGAPLFVTETGISYDIGAAVWQELSGRERAVCASRGRGAHASHPARRRRGHDLRVLPRGHAGRGARLWGLLRTRSSDWRLRRRAHQPQTCRARGGGDDADHRRNEYARAAQGSAERRLRVRVPPARRRQDRDGVVDA